VSRAPAADSTPADATLPRVLGVPGAVLLGLGSILGTGIFVSVGIAAEFAGPSVVLAVALGAIVALFNGLSSAALAASHPVSGGTYEYGYRYLNPTLGFAAGWTFLCAKSASAATAALGFAGYLVTALGLTTSPLVYRALAVAIVAALTLLVAGGMARSHRANAVMVGVTLLALASFVAFGAGDVWQRGAPRFAPFFPAEGAGAVLHATALMFVAYTGYGRVATLGEEIKSPERSIPRAVVLTLLASLLVYCAVTAVAVGTLGARGLVEATRAGLAPLQVAARGFDMPGIDRLIALGAITAMAGVILNLLLGLSRVLLAMARRRDMPAGLARLDERGASPRRAVLISGAVICALVCIGSAKLTWSFSASTVLVYYALTNLAALKLESKSAAQRVVAGLGLASCTGLVIWIEPTVLAIGALVLGVGAIWFAVARRRRRS
jgi:basic amino acid/polyamine antiporter, APA family